MGKDKRIRFHGKGPFSRINKLTTAIRMHAAITRFGLGGDALSDVRTQSLDEFLKDAVSDQQEKEENAGF